MEKNKISPQLAKRLLSSRRCVIFVEKAGCDFVTQRGIEPEGTVYVPREDIHVPLEDITRIWLEEGSDYPSQMEVEW